MPRLDLLATPPCYRPAWPISQLAAGLPLRLESAGLVLPADPDFFTASALFVSVYPFDYLTNLLRPKPFSPLRTAFAAMREAWVRIEARAWLVAELGGGGKILLIMACF